ncbi:MAG: hypothetical protein GX568_02125 [Candidatus Gastranaerophilales bacterium]|jgi:hypothetical protein|nr:hypothetical protein [Candidatus Gastranaerophilales bacterium]
MSTTTNVNQWQGSNLKNTHWHNNIGFGKWKRFEKLAVADWDARAARVTNSAKALTDKKNYAISKGFDEKAQKLQTRIDKHLSNVQVLKNRAKGRLSYHA